MNISKIIETTNQFIDKLETPDGFKLFERSEISPFARCFVIFNKSLTKQYNWLEERKQFLIKDLNIDEAIFCNERLIKLKFFKGDLKPI